VQPADRRFLRRAALATYGAGRHADSLAHWRMLLSGLESGTDDWFEAKYFQIACLQKTDPESAKQTLKQFNVLYPEIKSPSWKEKFAALAKNLE
jgi:hypothetical protein